MATWGYGFMVFPEQDRDTRYTDATNENNPSITVETRGDADKARDMAFAYIDAEEIVPPFRVIANGEIVENSGGYTFSVQVVVPSPPEE